MTKKSVQALLEDICLVSKQNYEFVEAVRNLVRKTFETSKDKTLAEYRPLALQATIQGDS